MMKMGVIGMSKGNAHPYSWSAIINGFFDGAEISRVGYPAVSAYLKANEDTLGLNGVQVTHVWTQTPQVSASIAKAANIQHKVENMVDMIGYVDAVLLARDDAENHVVMAKPFIDAGIPIFVDKPLAITTKDLSYFAEENAKGKLLMSCSSFRYSNECRTVKAELDSLGKIELVTAVGKKDWIKYGVHILEGVFSVLDDPMPLSVKHIGEPEKDIVYIEFVNGIQAVVHLFMNITPTFQISVFGSEGWRLIDIKNSYSMFRDYLIEFIKSVQERKSRLAFSKTENIIRTLIGAKRSLENNGKTIDLTGPNLD